MGCKAKIRSRSRDYGEDLQRSRPPNLADAHGAVICSAHPQGVDAEGGRGGQSVQRVAWAERSETHGVIRIKASS